MVFRLKKRIPYQAKISVCINSMGREIEEIINLDTQ